MNRDARRIALLELTCPWDSNVDNAHRYKEEKYALLVADLARDFKVFHYSVEISVRGQVSKENRSRLKSLAFEFCQEPKLVSRSLVNYGSKAALLGSFSLFSARNEPSWASPRHIIVNS